MKLVDVFNPNDLVYGFREDLENHIQELETKFNNIKYFSQSHVNKEIIAQNSEHLIYLTSKQKRPLIKSYGTIENRKITCADDNRSKQFLLFLALNFNKYDLTQPTPQCILFKRLCKQGIQYAKRNHSKIHFILDTIYDREEQQKAIINKKIDSNFNCTDCGVDSVTASELRSIYRDWINLQDTVVFWYQNLIVKAPWEDEKYSHLWKEYEPKAWKNNSFFNKESQKIEKIDNNKMYSPRSVFT